MSRADIGIDLGTANVLVYVSGKGIVLEEPSVVAIDKKANSVLAVGEEARRMIGRTPGNIVAIRPLRDGVISDYDVTEKMLKYFIQKAMGKKSFRKPRISVCVPSQVTETGWCKRCIYNRRADSGCNRGRYRYISTSWEYGNRYWRRYSRYSRNISRWSCSK